ncbi:MAG TPA: asparaginase [Actinomycetota bacterium]|nr:asparaginase [Actinomycetota bacterium]
MPPVPLVRVIRSGIDESVHTGSVAVADTHGALVAFAGEPGRPTFARSAMKPLQAAVSVSLAEEPDLSDAEVAVMCGSHNGELVHLRAVRSILERAGLTTEALRCPAARPLDAEEARRAREPRSEYHNCSGKHAGMLLASSRRGFPMGTYTEPDHPLQRAVREAVEVATGQEPEAEGVDGCGVPVHLLPLSALATLFARLVTDGRVAGAERVVAAMRAEPYLVAGRDRACTAIMETGPGLIVKVGAEGLMCAGIPEQGLGVAVRVDDGGTRAGPPAILRVLELLGAIDVDHPALAPFVRPPVRGGGLPVGELVAVFELQKTRTMPG